MNIGTLRKLPTAQRITGARKWLSYMLVVTVWASFQFYAGNKVYSLFIIVFLAALAMSGRAYFFIIRTSVVVVVVLSVTIMDAWGSWGILTLHAIQHPKETLSILFMPDSGRGVLPSKVQEMVSLLEANQVTSYQVASPICLDGAIMQRITEAAWPKKMDTRSGYLLNTVDGIKIQSSCITLDRKKEIELVYCH